VFLNGAERCNPVQGQAVSILKSEPAEKVGQSKGILSGQQAEQALPAKFATGVLREAVQSPGSKWVAGVRECATLRVEEH